MLREIEEGKDAATATHPRAPSIVPGQSQHSQQKQNSPGQREQDGLRQQLDLSQATVQELLEEELPSLRQQLDRSQATIQDLLESEFSTLDTKVVAVTLRDYEYDVAATREVLKTLSGL